MSQSVANLGANAIALPQHLPIPVMPDAAARHITAAEAREAQRQAFLRASREEREAMFVPPPRRTPVLSQAEAVECRRGAEYIDRAMEPISLGHLAAWLAPINASVRNPQSRDDLAVRVRALHEMLGDLPAGAFHVQARRALSPDWFPSAGEIRAAVEPGARQMRATAEYLRSMASPPPPPPEPARFPTDAERLAMRDAASRRVKELRTAAVEVHRVGRDGPVKALPVSDGVLLAHYDHLAGLGNTAAAMRADAIRARSKPASEWQGDEP